MEAGERTDRTAGERRGKPRLLEIEDLHVEFRTDEARVEAIDHVSLGLDKGETLGIVGESGCGKSVTAFSVMGLLPDYAEVTGRVLFRGEELLSKSEAELQRIRGDRLSIIFQEPLTSLNPVFTIEEQLAEVFRIHHRLDRGERVRQKVQELLSRVGIPNPERQMKSYPHQLSGGLRQRAMIAMALACRPDVLIADEPTTALDVTIQAQILVLMKELQKEVGSGLIMITHDLGVIAQTADMVAVMYAGQVVEYTDVRSLFRNPRHPYTRGLLETVPRMTGEQDRLNEIKGMVPDMTSVPAGCRFADRCPWRFDRCDVPPELMHVGEAHVRCRLYEGAAGSAATGTGEATGTGAERKREKGR